MSTNNYNQGPGALFKRKSCHNDQNDLNAMTPESPNYSHHIDVNKLQRTQTGLIRQFKAFVMGISGGDCAGKKEMINYMFDKAEVKDQKGQYWTWKIIQTGQSVAVLHQNYFIQDAQQKYKAAGTDWQTFKRKAFSLILGNQITININQDNKIKKIKIAPAKVVCIEGSHIFCHYSSVNDIMNLRVFIDSDSDVRLSRRIYKDTVQNNSLLDLSVMNYLANIKPSYQKQIQPTKVNCDVVVPHFGNGYADHKMKDRATADLNIKNITNLLLTQVRIAIKFYQDLQQKQKQSETNNDSNNQLQMVIQGSK